MTALMKAGKGHGKDEEIGKMKDPRKGPEEEEEGGEKGGKS